MYKMCWKERLASQVLLNKSKMYTLQTKLKQVYLDMALKEDSQ